MRGILRVYIEGLVSDAVLDSVELSADHAGRADFVTFRKVRFGLVLK